MNEKTCGIPSNTRKRQISHILETATTHATEHQKKGFAQQNINTNNTSVIVQNIKSAHERVAHVAGNVAVQISSRYVCYGGSYR